MGGPGRYRVAHPHRGSYCGSTRYGQRQRHADRLGDGDRPRHDRSGSLTLTATVTGQAAATATGAVALTGTITARAAVTSAGTVTLTAAVSAGARATAITGSIVLIGLIQISGVPVTVTGSDRPSTTVTGVDLAAATIAGTDKATAGITSSDRSAATVTGTDRPTSTVS